MVRDLVMLNSSLNKNSGTNKNELTTIVAAVLFIGLISFIGGYFIGVRYGARSFLQAHQQELLVLAQSETEQDAAEDKSIVHEERDLNSSQQELVAAQTDLQVLTIQNSAIAEKLVSPVPTADEQKTRFWAVAATVDSYAHATQLMENAASVNIVVRIKKVTRLSSKKKKRMMYQLVTPRYESQQELTSALEMLKTVPVWSKYIHKTYL